MCWYLKFPSCYCFLHTPLLVLSYFVLSYLLFLFCRSSKVYNIYVYLITVYLQVLLYYKYYYTTGYKNLTKAYLHLPLPHLNPRFYECYKPLTHCGYFPLKKLSIL